MWNQSDLIIWKSISDPKIWGEQLSDQAWKVASQTLLGTWQGLRIQLHYETLGPLQSQTNLNANTNTGSVKVSPQQ